MIPDLDRVVIDFQRGRISRRALIATLTAAGAAMAGCRGVMGGEPGPGDPPSPEGGAQGEDPTFQSVGLNHIALSVRDVERSRDFYRRHLGLSVIRESGSSCFLDAGDGWIALFRGEEARLDHYCFSISDYKAASAVERLQAVGLEARREGDRVYFDDPDGIELQVAAAD